MTIPVSTLCTVTGLSYRQVDHWITHGVLYAEESNPGSGYGRVVPPTELLVASVLAELRALNTPLSTLRRIGQQLRICTDPEQWSGIIFIDSDGWISRTPHSVGAGWIVDLDLIGSLTPA